MKQRFASTTFVSPLTRCVCALVIFAFVLVLTGPIAAVTGDAIAVAADDEAIRSACVRTIWTSLLSTSVACLLSIPTAYALTRSQRWTPYGDAAIDAVLALPPSVIGLCLLLLFRQGLFRPLDDSLRISLELPAVIIAQSFVATALATRFLRSSFDRLSIEAFEVAAVFGGRPSRVFWTVAFRGARADIVAAALIAWARAFGEFGPVLLFAGVTRGRTEVLSTAIHLELSAGRVSVAAVLAIGMIATSVGVTTILVWVKRRSQQESDA